MDFENWKKMIVEAATRISDRNYQQRSWFGQGPEISSPDELYNGFFDDSMIEKFLEAHGTSLTKAQRAAAHELIQKLNKYADETPEFPDPAKVIDDPAWQEIQHSALELVEL